VLDVVSECLDVAWFVLVMQVNSAKTAELIEVAFGGQSCVDPRNHVLVWSKYWRHLANTIEHSLLGSDVGSVALLWQLVDMNVMLSHTAFERLHRRCGRDPPIHH